MNDILSELNESQRDAVLHYTGPTLVIAGAGSGKTRVLTYRIAYMLQQGIQPFTVLALTFTNKAAREMKDRISGLVDFHTARRLWMGTFHSVFSKILRYESAALGYPSDYTIYDSADSKSLIRTIIHELNLDDKIYKPSEVQSRISLAKNNLVTAEAYAANNEIQAIDNSTRRPRISDIYLRYSIRCKRAGAMDFDDLLLNTNLLFRDHPAVLDKYRTAFRYLLIDEYQDTNYAQYLILHRLAGDHKNICVVGDDAQSIYSFRGARIENILKFKTDYPEARLIKLERNYRSTRNIVNAANSIILNNKEQISKKIFSEKEEGNKVKILEARTDNEEGYNIAGIIKDMMYAKQLHYRDFAVLYRTNAQSRIFEEALRKMNIPYKVYGGMSFFQRKEVKDALAYFRFVMNPSDDESLKRIINYPLRGIGKTTLTRIEMIAQLAQKSMWETLHDHSSLQKEFNKGTIQKLQSFAELISGYRKKAEEMEAFDLAYTIASSAGLIKELSQDKTPEGISRVQNLEELLNGIREFTENEENAEDTSLSAYLQTVTLYTDADADTDEDKDKVLIMTVHSAKGLEFKCVFIAGMEEELFPSFMSVNTTRELEEERRLFYVAVTRAMEYVFISYAATRFKWGLLNHCIPSRFISEINEEFVEPEYSDQHPAGVSILPKMKVKAGTSAPGEIPFNRHRKLVKVKTSENQVPDNKDNDNILSGMDVEHERFGRGKVISREGTAPNAKVTVFFKDHGQKQLLLKFARLKIIS